VNINFTDTKFSFLENHPDLSKIKWIFCSKDKYLKFEEMFKLNAIFFDSFLIDSFFDKNEFDELKQILMNSKLKENSYKKTMNRWQNNKVTPKKFLDKATTKLQDLLKTKDIELAYDSYVHYQKQVGGQDPLLPVHIDWSAGSYIIDLHIGGNKDWELVVHDKNFTTNLNQAVIFQPEFDFHYRSKWVNAKNDNYYQALFLNFKRKDHWQNIFGIDYVNDKDFILFQKQRMFIWKDLYIQYIKNNPLLPKPVLEDNYDSV
jgi:hypothetical protein